MQRIQQLNGYLELLPCHFYSDRATKLTKVVKPFDSMDLMSNILRMVPRNWHDQYKLMGATVSQSVWKLLEALERIKKAFPTNKECEGTHASAKGGGSSKKKMAAFSDWTPKKHHVDAKHCVLCKQHVGMHTTHTTMECHKYEKDRTPKKSFIGKGRQRNPRSRNAPYE